MMSKKEAVIYMKSPVLLIGWSKEMSQAAAVRVERPLLRELKLPFIVDRALLYSIGAEYIARSQEVASTSEHKLPKRKVFKAQEPHRVTDASTIDSSISGCQPTSSHVPPVCSLEDLYEDLSETDKKDFDSMWSVRKHQLQQSAEQRALVTFRQNLKERKRLEQVIDESLKQYGEMYEMAQVVKLHIEAEKNEWLTKVSQQYSDEQWESKQHPQIPLLDEQLCSECHRRKRQVWFSEGEVDHTLREGKRQRPDIVPFNSGLEDFQYDAADKEGELMGGELLESETRGAAASEDDAVRSVKKISVRKFTTPYKATGTTGSKVVATKAAVIEM